MLLFNRYEYDPKKDLIGKGGFSRVYKAFDIKFKRYLALKIYKTNDFSERYGPIAEIQRVIELDHPNIARYLDIDEVENEDSFGQQETIQVCVMELLEGGNLAKHYAVHKDLTVFIKLLTDVLHGLSYLHKNGIIHRDIKPANILIKNTVEGPIAKITDFGISKMSDASSNSSNSALIVSIPYMAPEQLNVKKYGIDQKVHFNIDLWSLGVAVYEIITGEVLFKNSAQDSSEQVMTNIISPGLPDKIKLLPSPFDDFVSQCVIKDAKRRIQSAEELLPFLQVTSNHKQLNTDFREKPRSDSGLEIKPVVNNENITEEKDKKLDINLLKKQENDTQVGEPNNNNDNGDGEETMLFTLPKSRQHTVSTSSATEDAIDETTILTAGNNVPGPGNTITEKKAVEEPIRFETTINNESHIQIPEKETGLESLEGKASGAFLEDNPEEITKPVEAKHQRDDNITGEKKFIAEELKSLSEVSTASEQGTVESDVLKESEAGKITLFNRYNYFPLTDLIGKGGFSRVYKAFDKKLSRWVALKIYKTGEFSDRYSPIAEIKRVINLDHSNICRYLDIEEIEKENPFGEKEIIQVCVMELLDGGNFSDFYHKSDRDEDVLKKLLKDILNGISYLHKNGIIHRDIKPANILIKKTIEGPVAKITDFGISKLSDSVNNNSSSALIVSIPYMAPEQLNPRKYGIKEKISYNLDLWSFGVTVYEVMTGDILFKNSEHDTSEQIMANIMAPELPGKISKLPQPFRNIISYCVVKNANDRAQKAEELLALLSGNINDTQSKASFEKQNHDLPSIPLEKTGPAILVNVEPSSTDVKKTALKSTISSNDADMKKDQWKKFTVVESTYELEKKARRHIGYLKVSIAVAALIFIAILLFYLFTVGGK